MSKENQISIYKIDRDNILFTDCHSSDEIIKKIINRANENIGIKRKRREGRRELDDYSKLDIRNLDTYDFNIKLFHSKRIIPNSWDDFLNLVIISRNNYLNSNHDFIVFVYNDDNIFCFTGGIACNEVDDIADVSFPQELMIRLSDPEKIRSAINRGLTGSLYARHLFFRGNYSISPTEAFGSIWKDIRILIRKEILDDPDWRNFLGEKSKDVSCDIKISFKIHKKVSFQEAIRLISKLNRELKRDLTPEQQSNFYFLNTIKIIENKEEKERLKKLLINKAYDYLNEDIDDFDYDFCHKDYISFFEANEYIAKKNRTTLVRWSHIDNAKQVLDDLKEFFTLDNFKQFFTEFDNEIKIISHNDDSNLNEPKDSIFGHLNGELQVIENGVSKNYFFIDKEWCSIEDEFLKVLTSSYKSYIKDDNSFCNIPLKKWVSGNEGNYNESYLNKEKFLLGDRITLNGVEFFDLLYFDEVNKKLYIIHVKDGLGSSTRDACSQLRNSAKLIEESMKENKNKKIKEFFHKLKNSSVEYTNKKKFKDQLSNIANSDNNFFNLFKNNKRIYVLAFHYGNNINDIISCKSNISKFEILRLKDDIKFTGSDFKLFQIK
jgi:hypothetical protein